VSGVGEVRVIPLVAPRRIEPEDVGGRTPADYLIDLVAHQDLSLESRDILVVSSKVASFFEGGTIQLESVVPGRRARLLAKGFGRDARKIELILRSGPVTAVIPMAKIMRIPSLRKLMVERSPNPDALQRGYESTNNNVFVVPAHATYLDEAGIDNTNTPAGYVTRLPVDPCGTARRIREAVRERLGLEIAVIVTDTVTCFGRLGSQDLAIGYAGIDPITRGSFSEDLYGVPSSGGMDLVIDSVAGIAGLVMGQTIERTPAALVRGIDYADEPKGASQGMASIAYPREARVRTAILTLVATLKYHVLSLLSLQRRPRGRN